MSKLHLRDNKTQTKDKKTTNKSFCLIVSVVLSFLSLCLCLLDGVWHKKANRQKTKRQVFFSLSPGVWHILHTVCRRLLTLRFRPVVSLLVRTALHWNTWTPQMSIFLVESNQINFFTSPAPMCRKQIGGAWWRRLVKSVQSMRCLNCSVFSMLRWNELVRLSRATVKW